MRPMFTWSTTIACSMAPAPPHLAELESVLTHEILAELHCRGLTPPDPGRHSGRSRNPFGRRTLGQLEKPLHQQSEQHRGNGPSRTGAMSSRRMPVRIGSPWPPRRSVLPGWQSPR